MGDYSVSDGYSIVNGGDVGVRGGWWATVYPAAENFGADVEGFIAHGVSSGIVYIYSFDVSYPAGNIQNTPNYKR